jgi:hypothetical protein
MNAGAGALFFRSSGACPVPTFNPRLAPWALFWRRFAADSGETQFSPEGLNCDTARPSSMSTDLSPCAMP